MTSDDRENAEAGLRSAEGLAPAASPSFAPLRLVQERPVSNGRPDYLEPTALEYLQGLRATHRRSNGQVYTPEHLVDFILDAAGYERDAEIDRASLLDPACGGGAFLEGAVLALARALRAAAPHSFRARLLETVEQCVFGIDVDEYACVLARQTVRRAVQSVAPGSLPPSFYDANVVCADFLTSDAVDILPPLRQGGFRFIVGNPPYVPATRIAPSYKSELCRRYSASSGRLDLYTVFIERSLALLTCQGRLAFITPDKFLVSQTGRALRQLIVDQAAVRMVALFRSHRIFEDAATVPA